MRDETVTTCFKRVDGSMFFYHALDAVFVIERQVGLHNSFSRSRYQDLTWGAGPCYPCNIWPRRVRFPLRLKYHVEVQEVVLRLILSLFPYPVGESVAG